MSDISLICKCCSPPRYYQSPVLLSVCDHIVCRDTVVHFGDKYVCSLCNSISDQLDTESDRVLDIVNEIERKYICKLHNQDIHEVCWTCNTLKCYLCNNEDCKVCSHDRKGILDCINVFNILDENIKKFMQDNTIKIQDNLDHLDQEMRNNKQIITRLRELKEYIKNRLENHYLQSLETEFSVLENRISSSINQLTETKQNINNFLINFNTKKSATQLYVQVLDWLKEKNSVCSYKIYSSTTFEEDDIIDQLLNSYYQPQQHSLTPTATPLTDQQQQFIITLKQCVDIKESIDTRPLLCYPIINSYKFLNLPKHPIVEPIINSQLDLFLNNNENDNNNNNIDDLFHILHKDYHVRLTRLFYLISEPKFQFNYLFFVKTLDDCRNILMKLDKKFSCSIIVGDRELIDLFNSNISKLTSVLIVYHRDFYFKYKDQIQYNYRNIKTLMITDNSDFKADHPNVNIFGEHVLEELSNEGLELLFNNLTDSIVSKDDIFYKPLMYTITKVRLKFMVEDITKDIRNKTKTPNDIIYNRLSYGIITAPPSHAFTFSVKRIFIFPVGEILWSLKVNYVESQTKQNNKWVPITIMQEPNECTDPYQLILTSEYAQIIVNNNTNGDVYNIKFDWNFRTVSKHVMGEGSMNLIPLSGTFESRSLGIQPLSLSNCFGSILYHPIHHKHLDKIEIDAIGYSFGTNNNNNNQNSVKRIAIRLVPGKRRINIINIQGMVHFIGKVKFIKDSDHTLIIRSNYSRFANNNQLIFKSKDNQPIPDRGNSSGNLCGDITLKDGRTIISFDIPAYINRKVQFYYLFFVKTLEDYRNILIKLGKNFLRSAIVGDWELIDLFNSKIIFKAQHPNINIFGEHVLKPLSNEDLELLFNNLTDSVVSKDDIFYKPLMYTITRVTLEFMIENLTKHIRNKTKTPNDIIYRMLSSAAVTISPSEIKPKNKIFKFLEGEMLWSFEVDYLESQTKQNNKWVPITIM
ncbi:hypothetical protein CYY_006526 [Polysphondylium violaceum]|uniref:Uncharacterized protein n=1 Tax=Polysphondylium violaceum TaxID=133409 RepID=A0A8J4UY60_9MYCE|nr:hypothetical protein CYY_006526 [Polysphondylium violaceum]